ncbi:MAG: hypothetical protein LAT55_07115 [Opitutales bacterium]|nr:hypothetical protein [Opitutales bacterium]
MSSLLAKFAPKRNRHQLVAGVEVAPRGVYVILLSHSGQQNFAFYAGHYEPFDPGLEIGSRSIASSLRRALHALPVPATQMSLWTTLARGNARLYPLSLPLLKRSHLPDAAHWAIQREDPFDTESTFCDCEPESVVEIDGRKLQKAVGLLCEKSEEERIVNLFYRAGYPVEGITLSVFALRNLFRHHWINAPGDIKAIVQIDWHYSRILLFTATETILVRTIPIGLDQMTEDLIENLSPAPDTGTARNLLLDLGRDPWPHQFFEEEEVFAIIRPTLDRLTRQFDRTLEYTQTKFPGREPPTSLQLAGHLTESPKCTRYLQDQTTFPLEVIDPFRGLEKDCEQKVSGLNLTNRSSFATALGLALSTPDQGPNLRYPLKVRIAEENARRINSRIFALFLVLTVLLGLFYLQQNQQLEALQDQRNRLESNQPETFLSGEQILARVGTLQESLASVRQSLEPHRPLAVAHQILALAPSEIEIHHIHQNLSGDTDETTRVRVEGTVIGQEQLLRSVLAIYRRTLEESVLFDTVSLRQITPTQDTEGHSILRFSMEILLPKDET